MMQGYVPLAVNEHQSGMTQFTVRWSSSIEPGMQGGRTSGGAETVSAQVQNHRWASENVPAFRNEPFMTSSRDFISRLDFELAGVKWPNQGYKAVADSWQGINNDLLAHEGFGMQLKSGGFLK